MNPNHARPIARDSLNGAATRLRRKQRQTTGLVEVPGPLPRQLAGLIRNLIRNVLDREREHDPDAQLLGISLFAEGLAVETSSERLAQNIANAIRRSHQAAIERVFDDESRRRILTCRLRGNR